MPPITRPVLRIGALGAVIACAAAGSLAAAHFTASSAADPAVTVALTACGTPPARLAAGPVRFQVTDDSRDFVNVYVIAATGNDVYAELQSLAPHATVALSTDLGAGSYALRCVFSNGKIGTSEPISVSGADDGAVPGYVPLPDLDMQPAVSAYTKWIGGQLPALLTASKTLDADVARGDLASARKDWLVAHLDYARLGAAYNAFGDFDGEIDGMADGLPDGVHDKDWTGLLAIEYGLWHGAGADTLRPLTKGLLSSVNGLIQDFPSEEVDPGDVPLRTHEILENALQFELTGIADYGSGTELATTYANAQGTGELLEILASLIQQRDPALLRTALAQLAAFQADLLADRTGAGSWIPVGSLSVAQRQRLDADLGALLESLAEVPDLLYPRTSA
ncbi:EfeM/EfeO family lipoprotein [Actinospica robiniae]|uniref:EfeM/EfeO family lipoprotein n=1 Tax=Actinospica robiniae TaxID=304901 RepID=UPI0003F97562|nr:EfeM/EfeO family lipoprotein [Actinospica robiniae]